MINGNKKIKLKMEKRSQRYDIYRPRLEHGPKYTKYKMCLSIMMVICIKQHLRNIWSSVHEKIKKYWGWVERIFLLIKKGMTHIWRPWKLSNFQVPPPPCQFTSKIFPLPWSWTSNFKWTHPPLQMKTNRLKENIIEGWLLCVIGSFLQIGFRFHYQLINLVWLSFDFFSFSCSLTFCFFVDLYSCVCSCPKISRNVSFIYNYSHF